MRKVLKGCNSLQFWKRERETEEDTNIEVRADKVEETKIEETDKELETENRGRNK